MSSLTVLVNRIGYETAGPKRFVCRSEENLGPSGHFEVTDGTGRTLLEGAASRVDPADSAGPFHYVGDFSPFRTAGGDFQVRFEAGNRLATSPRFGVGSDILWRLTKPLAVDFLRGSRATRPCYRGEGAWNPPGVLKDDDRFHDVGGGWFDRGSEGGTSLDLGARAVMALAFCLERDEHDPQVKAELRWGAEWLRRLMIGYPNSGRLIARAEDDGTLTPLPPRSPPKAGKPAQAGKPRSLLAAASLPAVGGATENGGASGCLSSVTPCLRGGRSWSASVTEPHWALVAGFLYARLSELLGDLDLLRRGERFWEEYSADLAGLESRAATGAMLLSEVALHVALLEPRYLASAERRAEALLASVSPAALRSSSLRSTRGTDGDAGEGARPSPRLRRAPSIASAEEGETAGPAAGRPSGPKAGRFSAWETPGASLPAAALTYFAESLPDHPLTPRAKEAVGAFLDERVARAGRTPLGLLPHDCEVPAESLPVMRAEEAWQALFAHRVTGRAEYVELAMNALNWLLGLNDRGACLLCGAGALGGQDLAPPSASPGQPIEGGMGSSERSRADLQDLAPTGKRSGITPSGESRGRTAGLSSPKPEGVAAYLTALAFLRV